MSLDATASELAEDRECSDGPERAGGPFAVPRLNWKEVGPQARSHGIFTHRTTALACAPNPTTRWWEACQPMSIRTPAMPVQASIRDHCACTSVPTT